MNVVCPKCRKTIPLEDVNVSADTALCLDCGKTFRFSDLASIVLDTASVDFGAPPPHVNVERNPLDGSITLTHRRFCKFAFFVIPFTMFWSGLSLWDSYVKQFLNHKFDLLSTIFGLPFLAGTVILVAVALVLVFGKVRVRLGGGRGSVFEGVGAIGRTRRFSYSPGTTVHKNSESATDTRTGKSKTLFYGITLKGTDCGTVKIYGNFTKEERDYIASAIARQLSR